MRRPPNDREWIDEDCWVEHHPGFVVDDQALRDELVRNVTWVQEEIRIAGRTVLQPRLTAWFGIEPDASSRYTSVRGTNSWPPAVERVRVEVETVSTCVFNACLANLYRDGRDSVAWHADDEPALGRAPTIASVSLGPPRRFVMKRRADGRRQEFRLGDGDLLLMGGRTQRQWVHAVPKTARPSDPRVNLTFRWYDLDRLDRKDT